MSIKSKFKYSEQNRDFFLGLKQVRIFTKRGIVKQWRWYLYSAKNWKLICFSNESFFNFQDCIENAKLTRAGLNDLLDTYIV